MKKIEYDKTNFILEGTGDFYSKYSIIQELGSGAFSKVLRVENKLTHEVFACKELIKSKIKDENEFRNEINIMSKCDHPNIIKLIEIYADKRYYKIIMEELTGGTLLERLIEKMQTVGEQIKLARLRRNLSMAQVADRATCSPLTVARVEQGSPSVSMGIYLRVLYALQLDDDILLLAQKDELGRALQDLSLKHRERASKK